MGGQKDSILDLGSRVILEGKGSSAEMISRAVSKDQSQIYSRGTLQVRLKNVRGTWSAMG
jgi:Fe-S cluster assembly scaffold protein SufB